MALLHLAIRIALIRQAPNETVNMLAHRRWRLPQIHLAPRAQHLTEHALVNRYVVRHESSGVQRLAEETRNAIEIRLHKPSYPSPAGTARLARAAPAFIASVPRTWRAAIAPPAAPPPATPTAAARHQKSLIRQPSGQECGQDVLHRTAGLRNDARACREQRRFKRPRDRAADQNLDAQLTNPVGPGGERDLFEGDLGSVSLRFFSMSTRRSRLATSSTGETRPSQIGMPTFINRSSSNPRATRPPLAECAVTSLQIDGYIDCSAARPTPVDRIVQVCAACGDAFCNALLRAEIHRRGWGAELRSASAVYVRSALVTREAALSGYSSGFHSFQTLPTRAGPGFRVGFPGCQPAGVTSPVARWCWKA